jgi:hypothetical protein
MQLSTLPAGTAHSKVPKDLVKALRANKKALVAWSDITPLARNEWICWIEEPKLAETRKRRVERTASELAEGKRRPCCWLGCIHRTDKAISPSVQWVLSRKSKTKRG